MDDFRGAQFQWANEYIANVDDTDNWLIEPLLPSSGIINLFGKPKSGKSFAAMGIAIAISSGAAEWNGFPIRRHGPVAYFQIDTPRGEWKSRWIRVGEVGYDISRVAIMDMKMSPYPYNIMLPEHRRWFAQQIEMIQPVLIVIDTLREVHEGDENNSTDMKRVINAIVSVAKTANAAIAFVSHSRKDSMFNQMGGDGDLMDEGRGSSYVSGRMDTIIKFTANRSKPMRGYMHYKGRSVEQNKMPITQDPESLLIITEGDRAKQDQLVLEVLRDHPDWTTNKQAGWMVEKLNKSISLKTATRRINEHLKLAKD